MKRDTFKKVSQSVIRSDDVMPPDQSDRTGAYRGMSAAR